MTYLSNIDLLNAEFNYRTEQLRGLSRRRDRRRTPRKPAAPRPRRG